NSRLEFHGLGGTLDGVRLDGDVVLGGVRGSSIVKSVVFVVNGLTLNGTATIYSSDNNIIAFNGPQTVTGGTFHLEVDPVVGGLAVPNGIQAFNGGPVLFDSTVTFRGGSGRGLTGNIISHADIFIDPGSAIKLGGINHINPSFAGPFVNRGTIHVL